MADMLSSDACAPTSPSPHPTKPQSKQTQRPCALAHSSHCVATVLLEWWYRHTGQGESCQPERQSRWNEWLHAVVSTRGTPSVGPMRSRHTTQVASSPPSPLSPPPPELARASAGHTAGSIGVSGAHGVHGVTERAFGDVIRCLGLTPRSAALGLLASGAPETISEAVATERAWAMASSPGGGGAASSCDERATGEDGCARSARGLVPLALRVRFRSKTTPPRATKRRQHLASSNELNGRF